MKREDVGLYLKGITCLVFWGFAIYFLDSGPNQTSTGCIATWLIVVGAVFAFKYFQEMGKRYWSQ